MKRSAILFDIDGTLLYAQGVGRSSFDRAFLQAYGVQYPDIKAISFVGATDIGVIRSMANQCGVQTSAAREEYFFFLLGKYLDVAMAEKPPKVFPGVADLLNALAARGDVLGLVTGNVRGTAWCKVRHGGLDAAFSFGGYGDESNERADIARAAIGRCPKDAVPRLLVGDTPRDVQAAHDVGLPALAVATGWVTADDLAKAGADAVLKDFSDTQKALAVIDGLLQGGMAAGLSAEQGEMRSPAWVPAQGLGN